MSHPHPSDHPLLIIFMVGGVTVSEVKMVKDILTAHKPGAQVQNCKKGDCWLGVKNIYDVLLCECYMKTISCGHKNLISLWN